ncbi:LOW QUALITY PROTEIN: hypothetical protein U9M48_034996, partial [Paspalum notatum var. saurae]
MGGEPVAELGVGRLGVAVGDEPLQHLGADVAGASPAPAGASAPAPAGASGRVARRGRALPDALLDAPTRPALLRRRRCHHPRPPRARASPALPHAHRRPSLLPSSASPAARAPTRQLARVFQKLPRRWAGGERRIGVGQQQGAQKTRERPIARERGMTGKYEAIPGAKASFCGGVGFLGATTASPLPRKSAWGPGVSDTGTVWELSTSHTRVLVNGEPGEPILHRRGLRQGDPLSPMLFLLVMEVLNALVSQATQENLLQPLAVQRAKFRISFYADDVIMFFRPAREDITLISQLLDFFGHVSGLRTNLAKSSVTPIHCSEENLLLLSDLLVCEIKNFPCTYLGIPLTVHKPRKSDIFPLIDKVADSLPKWKASLLNWAGRLVVVRAVLSAIPIHLMIALGLPKWAIKAIDKRRRGFLWTGKEKANGGNCFVAWDKVQRPLQYGGLGITNLETMGWALRIRWLWLQKTDSSRPWEAAVETDIGNGEDTKFWTDRWLQGCTIAELSPNLIKAVPTRARKRLSVSQALTNRRWIAYIKGTVSVQVLVEYLKLWELVDGIVLQPEISEKHTWKLSRSGVYTSKSAYQAFFLGSVKFAPWKRIWKSCAPLRCKFFLAVKNKCWTADHLSKRGLPHPSTCPLYDQAEETINHLLVSCVFSREIWSTILRFIGLPTAAPQDERSFSGWWYRAISRVPKEMKKGLNSLIILVAWELWKHINACVFEGVRPSVVLLCQEVERKSSLWRLAGNTALHELLTRSSRQ